MKQFVLGSAGQLLFPQLGSRTLLTSGPVSWGLADPLVQFHATQFLILSCLSQVAGRTLWEGLTKLSRFSPCDPAIKL